MTTIVAIILVGGGMAAVMVGFLSRVYAREQALAEILDLPYGEQDVPIELVAERHSALVESSIALAAKVVESVDDKGALRSKLELARVPLRPGEFVLVSIAGGLVAGVVLAAVTGLPVAALLMVGFSPFVARSYLDGRVRKRRRKFQEAMPDALSLIAGSLTAGHTFLRAIQMMTEEAEPPLSEEFGRVVSETQLGDPLVDALDRMSKRVQIDDVDFLVQAIRIQQTVGGRLADLLHTLSDFMRAREEIRREIKVLTAEGRFSAYILGALPVVMCVAISVMNPGYMDPLMRGKGWITSGVTVVSVVMGVAMIKRMVANIEI